MHFSIFHEHEIQVYLNERREKKKQVGVGSVGLQSILPSVEFLYTIDKRQKDLNVMQKVVMTF